MLTSAFPTSANFGTQATKSLSVMKPENIKSGNHKTRLWQEEALFTVRNPDGDILIQVSNNLEVGTMVRLVHFGLPDPRIDLILPKMRRRHKD